jgi:predicted permease
MFSTFLKDARYATRTLARAPGFTLTVILTLALGIGGATAVFSIVDSVLLKPLPYPDSDRLVAVWHDAPGAPGLITVSGGLRTSPSMYFTYAEHNRVFEHVGIWTPGTANVTGIAEPEEVSVVTASDGVLPALGVAPLLGRPFTEPEFGFGGPNVAILSYSYWQRRFGGDRSVIGRSIDVNSLPAEIIGVMPEGFRVVNADADLIVPLAFDKNRLTLPPFFGLGIARLKPGVTIDEANADVARMLTIWLDSWPYRFDAHEVYERGWKITPALRPLRQDVIGNVGNVLWTVLGTIGVVLLIACANVLNLLLVRAEGRQKELAIRAALGAGSGHLDSTLLAEILLLGTAGGVAGLLFAFAALRLLAALRPENLPRLDEIAIDAHSVVFMLLVTLAASLVLGLIPAFKHAGALAIRGLHAGGRGASAGRERLRAQNLLVVGQVALALVLLVSSGLMIRTFQALGTIDPGFTDPARLQTLRIVISGSLVLEPERVTRTQNDIADALAALPGVEAVGFATAVPLENAPSNWDGIDVEGQDSGKLGERPMRRFKSVSPGFFQAMGTPIVAGRELTWNEVHDLRPLALVSENLARELWQEPQAALGKRIRLGGDTPWREVIGVVADVRENGLQEPSPAIVYWPSMMENFYPGGGIDLARAVTFVVRSPLVGTPALARQIEQAVWSVNQGLAIASPRTMQDVYDRSLARTSFTLVMLAIAGGVALVLGVVGLYGVLSYTVAQRRREIAIRLALGARQRDVRRRFVREGVTLAAIGVVIGLGAAAGATRLMTALLYAVDPLDPVTYIAIALLLTAVAALASYLPARRASSVDPAEALAAE